MVWVLLLLLIAAVAGILGAVIKVTLIIVVSVVLAVALLVGGSFYYLRWRVRKLLRQSERPRGGRGYPTQGTKRPDAGPELPR
ncbi:MAG: hypothetical protein M3Q23_02270 [Actinomycetota bacterium]|nr:hypothetical protein [Actinomycetota bacterium]